MRQTTVGVRVAVAALGLVVVWLGVTPALIGATRIAVREKGADFDAQGAALSFDGIVFQGVSLRPTGATELEVQSGQVVVPWSLLRRPSLSGVRLGQVAVSGGLAGWRKWFAARRQRPRVAAAPLPHEPGLPFVVEELRWKGDVSESLELASAEIRRGKEVEGHARGLAVQLPGLKAQTSELDVTLSADLATVLGFNAKDASLEVELPNPAAQPKTVQQGPTVSASARDAKAPPRDAKAPPAVASAATQARAGSPATANGADVSESGGVFAFDPKRPERVARLVAGLGEQLQRLAPIHPFEVKRFQFALARAGERLEFGPGLLRVARDADRVEVSFAAGDPAAAHPFQLTAKLPTSVAPIEVELVADGLHLSELGVKEGNFGLSQVETTALRVSGRAEVDAAHDVARFDIAGALTKLNLHQPRLAPVPLAGMNLSWTLIGDAAISGSSLRITRGQLGLGAVQSELHGTLRRDAARLEVEAEFKVPRASCQSMFDSLPDAAVPLLAGSRLRGQFSWLTSLAFDSDRISDAHVVWRMQNGCRFERVSKDADTEQFRRPFTREVPGIGDESIQVTSGPGSDDWVPLSEVADALESAVLTTEDGGFWSHGGFQQQAIAEAIKQNLAAGKFQRGASTISMQLAKNLYLTREKYLARKVQEALLTMLLEQDLRKDELLELYFNVIEYGPGIYGIGPAAQHYFSATPAQLTTLQSFFLASVLPNPHASHFDEKGNLSSKWQAHLHRLVRIAERRGRISSEQCEAALSEHLKLGEPGASAGIGAEDTDDIEFHSQHD